MNWQLAALGSTTVAALLGTALAMSIGRASVVTYVVEVEKPRQIATAKSATQSDRALPTQTGLSIDTQTIVRHERT